MGLILLFLLVNLLVEVVMFILHLCVWAVISGNLKINLEMEHALVIAQWANITKTQPYHVKLVIIIV